jgi:hypothetical protein
MAGRDLKGGWEHAFLLAGTKVAGAPFCGDTAEPHSPRRGLLANDIHRQASIS